MSLSSLKTLKLLSERPELIRNFCMVAHVDHGKTTLSDYLVASNGVLSSQLAGEVRLLDSRPDEQERCITMKASSIALSHQCNGNKYLLNLVDSPGHIDFSSEVSTAMRLCDGALIIVDVVDGVTQQTCAMLRHAYREGLSMCLVLNKIDLLIRTQRFSAEEAYVRMRTLIETCNATLAAYANQMHIREEMKDMCRDDPSDDVWFEPTKGNVVFSSCYDGWAFDINTFVNIYAQKLPFADLSKSLWGEFYLDTKTKAVTSTPRKVGQVNLAVQFMLQPIWELYSAFLGDLDDVDEWTSGNGNFNSSRHVGNNVCSSYVKKCNNHNDNNCDSVSSNVHTVAGSNNLCETKDTTSQNRLISSSEPSISSEKLSQPTHSITESAKASREGAAEAVIAPSSADARCILMSNKLGIAEKVWNHPRRDCRAKLKALLSAWLPLAHCVLNVICNHLDSPVVAQARRLPALMEWPESLKGSSVEGQLMTCNNERAAPCIVYVCKLIDTQYLVGRTLGTVENEDDAFVGFARVYCGRLRVHDTMHIHSGGIVSSTSIGKLFIFRGAGLEETDEVSAGCLCGIGGITPYVVKYATLSSCLDVPLFRPLILQSTSIVRLSVFPKNPKDLSKLEKGMRLLYKVDAQVEIAILQTGEHVIGTAGEVHAERCIKDLRDTFAQIDLVTSEPIVSFRETVLPSRTTKAKSFTTSVYDGAFSITITARSLPDDVMEIIQDDERNHGNDANIMESIQSALQSNKRFAREMQYGIISYGPIKLGFVGVLLFVNFDDVNSVASAGNASAATARTTSISPNTNTTSVNANSGNGSVSAKVMSATDTSENTHITNCNEFTSATTTTTTITTPNGENTPASLNDVSVSSETSKTNFTTSTTNNTITRQERCMSLLSRWRESIEAGFQAAAEAGPMAQEPMYGIAFTITNITCHDAEAHGDNVNCSNSIHSSVLSGGAVLPCVRDACKGAMECIPRRLVEPIYECTVYSSGQTQGKIYALLSRRRAEIIEEVPNEGSDLFYIRCELPAVEAFGLQDDLRVHTQGASTAQLVMSRWSVIEADPYFVPTTREEIEEHGTELTTKNIAQLLLERIRRRKGLYRECVVENAEKQKFSLKAA